MIYPQSLSAFGQKKSENDLKLNVSFVRRVTGIGHSRIGGKIPRKSKKPAATGHLGAVIPLAAHTNLTACAIRIAPITRQSPAIPEGRRTKINYTDSIPQDIEIVNANLLYLVFLFFFAEYSGFAICLFMNGDSPGLRFTVHGDKRRTLKKNPAMLKHRLGFIPCPGGYTGAADSVHSAHPPLKCRTAAA